MDSNINHQFQQQQQDTRLFDYKKKTFIIIIQKITNKIGNYFIQSNTK
jgi:hypothetical protein